MVLRTAFAAALPTSEHLIPSPGAVLSALLGARGCLFTFHRAAPTDRWETLPNREFYLDLGFLDRLLSYLTRNGWDVVTLDEVFERQARGEANNRFVNFSVDDCYRDTFESVVPLFRRHGLPVTLFVTTGIPDGTLPMWGAGLEDVLLDRDKVFLDGRIINVPTLEAKRAAFRDIAAAWDGPEARRHYAEFCRQNAVDIAAMHEKHAISWDMLEALRGDPLVEIGGHSVSHARIASLSADEARAEIAGCRERLITRLGVPARHFAFPYGRAKDCGPRDFAIARDAGFVSAATTRKGLVRPGQDVFTLPRNTLNGAHRSLAAIEVHLTGMSGIAARVLGRV